MKYFRLNKRIFENTDYMQKEISQKETSLTNIIKLIAKRFYRDNIMGYAYHVAYNLLLSFFPFLIFLITLVGYAVLA